MSTFLSGKMPQLDYSKLNKTSAMDMNVIDAFLNKQELSKGKTNSSGKKQWVSDGEYLNYFGELIAYYEDDNIIISDGGYKTMTTKEIINTLLNAIGNKYNKPLGELRIESGNWYIINPNDGKKYKWMGTLKISPNNLGVLENKQGQPLPELSSSQDIGKQKRQLIKDVDADVEKLKNAIIEHGGINFNISNYLDSNKYGEDIHNILLWDLLYVYYENKHYKDPDYVLQRYENIVSAKNVNKINSIKKIGDNKVLVEYDYTDQYSNTKVGQDEMELAPNMTISTLPSVLTQEPKLSDMWESLKKDIKKALTDKLTRNQLEQETGLEYSVV